MARLPGANFTLAAGSTLHCLHLLQNQCSFLATFLSVERNPLTRIPIGETMIAGSNCAAGVLVTVIRWRSRRYQLPVERPHTKPVDLMKPANIRIVLTRTSHPGNIGAAARAMKNMGLSDLALVKPEKFPHAEATARASGADDLLASARVYESLQEAIADCHLVLGASARQRSLAWPQVDARTAAGEALAKSAHGPVAVVFGNEQSGLSNEELDHCRMLLNIPANPNYSSLNLSQAVQVVTYELMMAAAEDGSAATSPASDSPPATSHDLEVLFTRLEALMIDVDFLNPEQPRYLLRRIRRLIYRAGPDENEINILQGIVTKVAEHLKLKREN